ncbi:hypothetical protein QTO01_08480 [Vibrio mytili]
MKVENGSEPTNYEFGYWPEVLGIIITVSILLFLFGYSEGML